MSDLDVCGIRLTVGRSNERERQITRSLPMHDADYLVMESIFPVEEDSADA